MCYFDLADSADLPKRSIRKPQRQIIIGIVCYILFMHVKFVF